MYITICIKTDKRPTDKGIILNGKSMHTEESLHDAGRVSG